MFTNHRNPGGKGSPSNNRRCVESFVVLPQPVSEISLEIIVENNQVLVQLFVNVGFTGEHVK